MFVLTVQCQVPYEHKFPKISAETDCTFLNSDIKTDTVGSLKTADSDSDKPMKNSDKKSEFGSSWKFYAVMLAFPVILIILLILVFLRGKKR
jgi:hypothetical protein